jgi:hypothetical protein
MEPGAPAEAPAPPVEDEDASEPGDEDRSA